MPLIFNQILSQLILQEKVHLVYSLENLLLDSGPQSQKLNIPKRNNANLLADDCSRNLALQCTPLAHNDSQSSE